MNFVVITNNKLIFIFTFLVAQIPQVNIRLIHKIEPFNVSYEVSVHEVPFQRSLYGLHDVHALLLQSLICSDSTSPATELLKLQSVPRS